MDNAKNKRRERLKLNVFDVTHFKENRMRFRIWGISLVIVGTLAIVLATFTTLISMILLGVFIFACGVVILVDAFTVWWRKWKGFFVNLLFGILYVTAGIILFKNPVVASFSLTLLLGAFYLSLGIFRLFYSLYFRMPKWGWSFLNGVISLLLGVLILLSWPASSLYIIGWFVGIDLIFTGWAYLMSSLPIKATI